MPLPEIYSPDEVAEHFKISREYLIRKARRLGSYVNIGTSRRMMFTLQHVDELLGAWRGPAAVPQLTVEQIPARADQAQRLRKRPFTCASLAEE